ncbi:hypothetical protein A2U01_0055452, partial [Trifolium medium]|nr:hypothetical protein [Trifolium medium]
TRLCNLLYHWVHDSGDDGTVRFAHDASGKARENTCWEDRQ